ncbi:hypothetical protein [Vreelandella aquamarina]|uniref:hypothetical protein n=1 Tax=Vreelandella aquamarina TaxID=77097 RepID=UPI0007858E51|nr:hypothetical protein [Halomonas axialensis]
MNATHIELRAQQRAKGINTSGLPRIASRFNPEQLRGKNAARWHEYTKRRSGKAAALQLWEA